MADNSSRNSDKIMIRRPDGTFEILSVEGDKFAESVFPIKDDSFSLADLKNKPKPEVKKNAKPQITASVSAKEDFSWEEEVAKVMEALPQDIKKLEKFKDDSWRVRLEKIILSRLRDVRDWLNTKESLTKDPSAGGSGLNEAQAAAILNIIESNYKNIHSDAGQKNSKNTIQPRSDVMDMYRSPEKISALVEADLPVASSGDYQQLLAEHLTGSVPTDKESVAKPLEKLPDNFSSPIQTAPKDIKHSVRVEEPVVEKPMVDSPESDFKQPKEQPAKSAAFYRADQTKSEKKGKPTLNDVLPQKRLMGPVDELRNLRLMDFRRLGGNTSERLEKIMDKIAGLEEESFEKKAEAIKAWRLSPLYRRYIAVGQDSLEKNISMEKVIADNLEKNSDDLTEEEFNKISDFNKKLRY